MASSRPETGITWSSAASVTLSSATASTSDAFSYNLEDWDAELAVHVDNAGTPASGDVVNVRVAYSGGNIDGSAGDDYATTEHAESVGRLDTWSTNSPGEDPALLVVPLRTGAKALKLVVDAPQAASRNIVVRAGVITHRPQ